ncbi:MAG: hypothetical protein ACD_47C00667G0002 [uncultured bacterium]|nr:MAG: hypothetical protein ACD_47C00667G0002 [uncultured bacterium]
MPPISMNAPYSVKLLTVPLTVLPSWSVENILSSFMLSSASTRALRDNIILLRFLFTSRILKSYELPM